MSFRLVAPRSTKPHGMTPRSHGTMLSVRTEALFRDLQSHHPSSSSLQRRHCLAGLLPIMLLPNVMPAHAGVVEDALRSRLRPDVEQVAAVVDLLDARATLVEMQSIVESDAGSSVRRTSQRMLPTYARYLRAVGKAAPVIGALSTGRDAESLLGEEYGGTAGATPAQTSPVTAVYSAVGRILNYSGRGVRPEAMKSPETISAAIAALDGLLGSTPESLVKRAQEQRGSSRGVSGV
ncbi:hypothetical protein ACKKBF_B35065 [Auxenochlorella protothecoides x Auxenochlorella symbiontica]